MTLFRKKPWNRVDNPVYSISSNYNGSMNMNICSYAIPVSLKPKRYIIAIYKNTLTLELVKKSNELVLQFLSEKHASLVSLLGQKSGFSVDKLEKIKSKINYYDGYPFLQDCNAIVKLKCIAWLDSGDHWCALAEVVTYRNINNLPPLTLEFLRAKKIIRA